MWSSFLQDHVWWGGIVLVELPPLTCNGSAVNAVKEEMRKLKWGVCLVMFLSFDWSLNSPYLDIG